MPSSLTRVLSSALEFSSYLPVSVLVRTPGHLLEVFLGRLFNDFDSNRSRSSVTGCLLLKDFSQATLTTVNAHSQPCDHLQTFVTPSLSRTEVRIAPGGAGMLTCCPSATPFGLALGPPNPGRIYLPQETLGFRRGRFSLPLSLLMAA